MRSAFFAGFLGLDMTYSPDFWISIAVIVTKGKIRHSGI